MSSTISLLLTTYNRSDYLAAAIESVLAQTYPDFELLIWDDGSTDAFLDIAQRYTQQDRRVRLIASPHQGRALALRSVHAQAKGIYVGWIDSDDMLAPTALQATVEILDTRPQIGMVYTDYWVTDESGQEKRLGKRCSIPYSPNRLLVEFMTFHFRLIRRSLYEQVGGIDTTFSCAMDYDLCLKLSEVTQVYHLPQPLYFYRTHDHSLSNEHRSEQTACARRAVENALIRRKLGDRYQLEVEPPSRFRLRRKSQADEVNSPKETEMKSTKSLPTVSVIVPTYNRKQPLALALASVTQQTYQDYEVIVVDDGSSDGTQEWLHYHYPQFKTLRLATNRGAAAARNVAIQQARGSVIAFLDSDDQWHPEYLHVQTQSLLAHPDAILSYCDYMASVAGQSPSPVSLQPSSPDLIAAMLLGNFIHTFSQIVLPAAVFQQVGLLDERLSVCHDREYYLRLFQTGKPVHVPQALVVKRWLPDSIVVQDNCQNWLQDGLKLLELFFSQPQNAAYAPLQPQAEQILRSRVTSSQRYFSKVLPSPPTGAKPQTQSGQFDADVATIRPAEHYTPTPDLWLMTAYFNPSHYKTKRVNYQHFKQRIAAAGLRLLTVECAFGDADFDLADEPDVLQLRCADVMWQRERLINFALDRLPPQATKVAWIDCDILFSNPNWAVDTVRLLDQFPIVQLFSQAIRLLQGQTFYNGTAEGRWHSFAAVHAQYPEMVKKGNAHKHGHTGFGWAARREIWQKHGLYDALIVGAADHLTAHAMCNDFESPCVRRHLGINPPQLAHFCNWGKNLYADIQGRIGCTPGTVLHLWHGNLSDRQYVARHDKLAQFAFDPERDIKIGQSGAWEWCSDKPELHQWMVDYFHQRQEDGG